MHIIILSGGSGTRLWPLSNDIRSKQFIKIFRNPAGREESMLQRIYRQISAMIPNAQITIATSKKQVPAVRSQLPDAVSLCVEPCQRDTFPAMALAAAWLHDVKQVPKTEIILACPVDSYVEDDYFKQFMRLNHTAEENGSAITLIGIEPTYPSAKYGYLLPDSHRQIGKIRLFHEKPDEETARKYIAQGGLWSGGVFALRLGYLLDKAHEQIDFLDYADLYDKYHTLTSISFDHAVVERELSLAYLRYNGSWKALGTWNTLTESMETSSVGHAIFDDSCSHVNVINELNVPILCMGLSNIIISASPAGVLVSDRQQSSNIKSYVEKIHQHIMFAEKSWGDFRVLDFDDYSMTIKIILKPGQHMNYHSHEHRDEIWTIVSGKGKTIVDGMEQIIRPGDVITMQAGCRHTIVAETELQLIEIQLGKGISVQDKQKYEYEL